MSLSLEASPDPLAIFLAPPPNESAASRALRMQAEVEARRVSEQIDEELRRERTDARKWEKEKKTTKVLLLGQSESGKSTTIKNFQMAYAPSFFAEELYAWRTVIYLNLTKSLLTVLELLQQEVSQTRAAISSSSSLATPLSQSSLVALASSSSAAHEDLTGHLKPPAVSPQASTSDLGISNEGSLEGASSEQASPISSGSPVEFDARSQAHSVEESPIERFTFTQTHAALLARLLPPLQKVEETLEAILLAPEPFPNSPYGFSFPFNHYREQNRNHASPHEANWRPNLRRPKEFAVTTRTGWRAALMKVKERISTSSAVSLHSLSSSERRSERRRRKESMDVAEVTEVLAELGIDMQALWDDEGIQALLRKRKMRLEERSGFFLNDISRITKMRYIPTSDDVVRARLRTMGVQEYRFVSEKVGKENTAADILGRRPSKDRLRNDGIQRGGSLGMDPGREWIIYDVGGARCNRQAWLPYFTSIHAIIFLAPISCFDERLAEDPRVNRLEDSLNLWKTIASTDILKDVQLILFLNKCDILHKKLQRGVRVANYISSYGNRPNDSKSVAKYLRHQFKDILHRHSPKQRQFYSFFTSVIDTKATAITVAAVREGIQRSNLRNDLL